MGRAPCHEALPVGRLPNVLAQLHWSSSQLIAGARASSLTKKVALRWQLRNVSLSRSTCLLLRDAYRGTVSLKEIPNTETLWHLLGRVLGNHNGCWLDPEHSLLAHRAVFLLSLVPGLISFPRPERSSSNTQSLSFLLWQRPGSGAAQGTKRAHRCLVAE